MVRRQLITRNKKKFRVTKSETWLVNHKYLGDEPLLKDNYSAAQFGNALTWYNYMLSTNDAREYLETYLKHNNRLSEAKKIKSIPDTWIPTTAAWISRIILRGTNLSHNSLEFLENSLQSAFKKSVPEKKEEHNIAPVISIQDRIKERVNDIIGDIEILLDKEENFKMYEWLQVNEIPAIYANKIADFYQPLMDEYLRVINGDTEGYERYTKKQMFDKQQMLSQLLNDCRRYTDTTKKIRKPRKPRAISVEKKLKFFKCQKENSSFKIASVPSEKIIGCQELWLFNTKYKTLTVLRAIDRGGIQIKGTSFTGYDEKNSFTKKTGRKPEYYLDKVLNSGKITLRKLMDEIKGEVQLSYRSNENTVLLRVI